MINLFFEEYAALIKDLIEQSTTLNLLEILSLGGLYIECRVYDGAEVSWNMNY